MSLIVVITFLFYLCIACAIAADTKPKDPEDSQLGWFPYVVSLRVNNVHHCGGCIIDSTHILTAAHCLQDVNSPSQVEVVTSTIYLDRGGEVHRVAKFFASPNYPAVDETDVAVLKLLDPIVENKNQRPIALNQEKPPTDAYGLLVGWGEIPNLKPPQITNTQQYVYVWMISDDDCRWYYPQDNGHICTSTMSNIGVCPGDSGSPLIYNDKVIGVASRGICARGQPDLFASVYANRDFIYKALQS